MLKRILLFAATLTLAFSLTAQAETMTLIPTDGALSGAPGSMVGWGFTITSDTYYLLLFDVAYSSLAGWGDFTGYTTDIGSVIVEPGIPVTHTFDALLQTGVGSFTIHHDAVPGSIAVGTIEVPYGQFSVNPNDPQFNPDTDIVSLDKIFSNSAAVTVTGASNVVPEPSTFLLLGAGLGGLALWRRMRK